MNKEKFSDFGVRRNYDAQAWAKMVPLLTGRPDRENPINQRDVDEIKRWNEKFKYPEQYLEMMKG